MPEVPNDQGTSAVRDATSNLLTLARRRWGWIVGAVVLVVALAAVRVATQEPVYESTSDVLLTRQNLANSLTDTVDPSQTSNDYARVAQTQAAVASSPVVLSRALARAGLPQSTLASFQSMSDVTAQSTADILRFSVRDTDSRNARRLTAAYAGSYIAYRRELDTAALRRALAEVSARLAREQRNNDSSAALRNALSDSQQRLETLAALQTANAYIVRPASAASQVAPRPARTLVIAAVFGFLLGMAMALLRDRTDTRYRQAADLAEALRLPLLARLTAPPEELGQQYGLVMRSQPGTPQAEAFRLLRTTVELANVPVGARTFLVTSAVESEGKSTTTCNLALTLARAGQRVALLDLDLRKPTVNRFFGLQNDRGATLVAAGLLPLQEAIVEADTAVETSGMQPLPSMPDGAGRLFVLPAGPPPPDPGQFVSSEAVASLIRALAEQVDVLLIDTPPLLRVGDALALSKHTDVVLLVGRLGVVRRPMVNELRRQLDLLPVPVLGLTVTGADVDEQAYEYSYGYQYGEGQMTGVA